MPIIQVVGGIATGKSTLLEIVAQNWQISAQADPFQENVFLTDFYDDPVANAFETETLFALLHYRELKRLRGAAHSTLCDFSLFQDAAYADVTLAGSKQRVFLDLIRELRAATPEPFAIIHVRCEVSEQLSRIAKRGRVFEQGITAEYLNAVNDSITARIQGAPCPVYEVDSGLVDYRHTSDGIRTIIDHAVGEVLNK